MTPGDDAAASAGAAAERYREFVENSTEGIWRFELEEPVPVHLPEDEQVDAFYRLGFLAEANDAFARMYGFESGAELVGARLGDLLVRDDPANDAYLRALVRSGYRLSDAESVERDRGGGVRHFSNTLTGVVEGGFLVRAWGTQRDVTALRATERVAAEIRLVTDAAPLLIAYVGPDLRYRFVNRGYSDWFGLSRERIVGSTVPEVIGAAAFEKVRPLAGRALAGERVSYEALMPYADGERPRFVHGEMVPDVGADGAVRGYVVVLSDVSARRAAEAERERLLAELEAANARQRASLADSEERFRLLVEGVRDYAIFMLDPDGNVATWNAGAERFNGYTAREIIGEHFSRFYTEEDVARRHPWNELEVAAREGHYEEEGWRVRKGGSLFWAHVLITALRDGRGELRGFAKVTRDVTERRERERERREREREHAAALAAAQAAEQQRRFLKDVLRSVTEGKLILCDDPGELPAPLAPGPGDGDAPLPLTKRSLKAVRARVGAAAAPGPP